MKISEKMELARQLDHNIQKSIAGPLGVENLTKIEEKNGAQSRAFLIEILPFIWKHLDNEKRYSSFEWLDVGPGAGYAAGLLSSIHLGTTLGYKLNVSVIDINNTYQDLINYSFPNIIEFFHEDIYDHSGVYDYISCSHVIEHVPSPAKFLRRLQGMARKRVFVLTPWKERSDIMTKGHINTFDEKFLQEFPGEKFELLHSVAWGAFLKPRYKMVFLDLPGLVGD